MYSIFDMKINKGFRGFLENIKYFPKSCKWAMQRMKWGFSDYDIMDMDAYLEELIPDMISRFIDKQTPGQYPVNESLIEKAGISIKEYEDLQSDMSEEGETERKEMAEKFGQIWEETLARIIFCFREQDERRCTKQNEYSNDYYALIHSGNKDEEIDRKYWDREKELEEYREQMLKEGFDLLYKYFHCFWW